MTYSDHRREARSHSARAGAFTRQITTDAEKAADFYRSSAGRFDQARWLTARPFLWDVPAGYTPALLEETGRSYQRLGDLYLRTSYEAEEHAAFYRELAGRYRNLADLQDARVTVAAA